MISICTFNLHCLPIKSTIHFKIKIEKRKDLTFFQIFTCRYAFLYSKRRWYLRFLKFDLWTLFNVLFHAKLNVIWMQKCIKRQTGVMKIFSQLSIFGKLMTWHALSLIIWKPIRIPKLSTNKTKNCISMKMLLLALDHARPKSIK